MTNEQSYTHTHSKVDETNKKMSYDNDQEDDDDQPQNITDEMEQKRLEEAAASVEWVFCFSCYVFILYVCVYMYHMEMKGLEDGVKKCPLYHSMLLLLLLLLYTLYICMFCISFILSLSKYFC